MKRFLRDMTPAEVDAAVRARTPLFVPAGCVECHANHLPLGTDTLIAEGVAEGVADMFDGVVAPTIDYGPTGFAVSGPELGTIDVATEPFYGYVKAVLAGLLSLGFPHVFVVVHHQDLDGPEAASFHLAQAALFSELHRSRGAGWWGRASAQSWPQVLVLPTIPVELSETVVGDHAGRTETSLVMHMRPGTVDIDAVRPGDYWYTWVSGHESARATATDGERLLGLMTATMADAVRAALTDRHP